MFRTILTLTCFATILSYSYGVRANYVVDFENIALPAEQYLMNPTLNGISIESTAPWGSQYYVSEKRLMTDPNFYWTNGDDSAVAAGGADASQQWLAAFNFSPGDAVFVVPDPLKIRSVRINNVGVVDHAVRHGLHQARAFIPGDFLRVRFLGFTAANQPSGLLTQWIDLARYENSLVVLSDWTTVDLTSLNTNRLGIEIEGSDIDRVFGLNTPTYLALDNFEVSGVPEPSSLLMVVFAGSLLGFRARQGRLG